MTAQTFSLEQLTEIGTNVLTHESLPHDDARLVAHSLATSDAWGHPSHGMLRLSWYVARLRSGVMTPITVERTVLDLGALAVLDGADGVGQIITERAATSATDRARKHGVGAVLVRNSNHFGTAAYWTRRMADTGCVGILTTNGSPAMAPWGGRDKTVGANPWSIAVPHGDGGVVLDIANTGVARGKIYSALQKGEPIPLDWALDSNGVPTTDAQAAIEGVVLPMAQHKGYGISFMMDVLSGVLTGSSYATDIAGPYVPDRRSGCGHLLLAIDIEQVIGTRAFAERMDDLIRRTKSVPLADGAREILYPGEMENRSLRRAKDDGIWLPDKTVVQLKKLSDETGAAWPIEEAA